MRNNRSQCDQATVDALYNAARNGELELVRSITARCPQACHGLYERELTPLHAAILQNNPEVVLVLLRAGTDPSAKGKHQVSAVELACERGKLDFVKLLLNAGATLDLSRGLHYASQGGYADVVSFLLNKGAPPNAKDSEGRTALQLAVSTRDRKDRTALVRALLEGGADPKVSAYYALHTPLHLAAAFGATEMVALLIQHGASLDVIDKDGSTPLHIAAKYGRTNVVEILIRAGADPNKRDKENKTPAMWAKERGHRDLVALLSADGQ